VLFFNHIGFVIIHYDSTIDVINSTTFNQTLHHVQRFATYEYASKFNELATLTTKLGSRFELAMAILGLAKRIFGPMMVVLALWKHLVKWEMSLKKKAGGNKYIPWILHHIGVVFEFLHFCLLA
jgi:hypothetical protein